MVGSLWVFRVSMNDTPTIMTINFYVRHYGRSVIRANPLLRVPAQIVLLIAHKENASSPSKPLLRH